MIPPWWSLKTQASGPLLSFIWPSSQSVRPWLLSVVAHGCYFGESGRCFNLPTSYFLFNLHLLWVVCNAQLNSKLIINCSICVYYAWCLVQQYPYFFVSFYDISSYLGLQFAVYFSSICCKKTHVFYTTTW